MIHHIGELNQRVTLKSVTLSEDGEGGATDSWGTVATVWAKVTPLTGRERASAMRQEANSDYLVVVRARDDLKEGDRIEWRGREMNIRFIRSRGPREQFLEIEAEMGATT